MEPCKESRTREEALAAREREIEAMVLGDEELMEQTRQGLALLAKGERGTAMSEIRKKLREEQRKARERRLVG